MIYQTIQKCRISKKKDLVSVGKFGGMALTGTFPKSQDQKIPHLPFEVVYSKSSKLWEHYSRRLTLIPNRIREH